MWPIPEHSLLMKWDQLRYGEMKWSEMVWYEPSFIRTRHAGGHEGGEHEKEHSEEETSGVVVDLGRLVADVHVQQADQNADRQVRYQPQPRQRLHTVNTTTTTRDRGDRYGPTEWAQLNQTQHSSLSKFHTCLTTVVLTSQIVTDPCTACNLQVHVVQIRWITPRPLP